MSRALPPEAAAATAATAGLPFTPQTAERVSVALSPALTAFAALAGTLPFDLEPAGFVQVQRAGHTEAGREEPK